MCPWRTRTGGGAWVARPRHATRGRISMESATTRPAPVHDRALRAPQGMDAGIEVADGQSLPSDVAPVRGVIFARTRRVRNSCVRARRDRVKITSPEAESVCPAEPRPPGVLGLSTILSRGAMSKTHPSGTGAPRAAQSGRGGSSKTRPPRSRQIHLAQVAWRILDSWDEPQEGTPWQTRRSRGPGRGRCGGRPA